VPESEARKVYVAQANDWNAYRQKLASAAAQGPAKQDSGGQSSAGKIAPKVEEKAVPADQSKDQVKISRAEQAALGKGSAAVAENAIAKEKALNEAQNRLTLLEKNVNDLQKLVETKNQKLAELEKQADTKKDEPKPAQVPIVAAPKVVEAAKPIEAPKPVEAVVPEPAKVAEPAPKPVEAVKPPEPPKKVLPPPPEPEPEPSFVDELLGDPLPLAGGAAILALLGGYFFAKRRRQSEPAETTAAPGPSSLGPNSVFRMTGGQSVDTGNTPPQTGDFSQTGPGTIDTDEVDPVAEADVYMAYGRDAQAEEILIEALQKDPQRTAIHAKLLEIYANRKSLKQFETLASELYAQTGGNGPEWAKVAVLGAGLDPENPLYASGRGAASPVFDADATMIVSPELAKATLAVSAGMLAQAALAEPSADDTFVGQLPEPNVVDEALLVQLAGEPDIPLEFPKAQSVAVDDVMSLDFDLGSTNVEPDRVFAPDPEPEPEFVSTIATGDSNALDFDLGVDSEPLATREQDPLPADQLDSEIIDFDIGTTTNVGSISFEPESSSSPPEFSPAGTMLMPNLDSMTSTFVGHEALVASEDLIGNETIVAPNLITELEPEEVPLVDFDLDMDADRSSATVVNPDALHMAMNEDAKPMMESLPDEDAYPSIPEPLSAPVVDDDESLDFDIRLTDSTVLGQPMATPSYDIGSINLDLSSDAPPESESLPEFEMAKLTPSAESLPDMAPPAPASEFSDAQREEVSTKLDLAKAYEEMGDLEGARELLLEVALEGPPDLVEQAQEILGRIGE
jgi:pilus assembly protein FimV